jgi:ribosomal protein S18 acetylase RimI-like enzyme
MKLNITIIFSITAFLTTAIQCSEVVIKPGSEIRVRPATENDLPAIFNLTHTSYETDFKPLWKKDYASLSPQDQTHIDEFAKAKEHDHNNAIKDFIKRQANKEDYCVLIALMIKPNSLYNITNQNESFTGYCVFQKLDATTIYINRILVDPTLRKKGIAKILARAAFAQWNTVTQCKVRALILNDEINTLYKNHGCTQTNEISLDSDTGNIVTDSNAPKTHYEYTYTIQKK